MSTWTLSPAEYAATVERIEKINTRAAKRGFTGRLSVTGTEREVTETDEFGFEITYVLVDAEITGEAPSYNGWTFLAAVDTVETEDGPEYVLRTAPGVDETTLDRSNLKPGQCEHCKVANHNRVYTYLVRNTEGETMQVGTTCIKDFLGWDGKPVFISVKDITDDIEAGLSSSHDAREYTPQTIIAIAWAISRQRGWVPSSAMYSTSTRSLVDGFLFGRSRADNELRAEIRPELDKANEKATTIIDTLRGSFTGASEYEANMLVCLKGSYVNSRHLGLVVSAVSAYEKVVGAQQREALHAKAVHESQFAGVEGEKITVTGTITSLIPVEGSFGYMPKTKMLVLIEAGTTVAKMWTTAAWAFEAEQGDEITVTGTVKAHEEFRGVKQTALSRAKRLTPATA